MTAGKHAATVTTFTATVRTIQVENRMLTTSMVKQLDRVCLHRMKTMFGRIKIGAAVYDSWGNRARWPSGQPIEPTTVIGSDYDGQLCVSVINPMAGRPSSDPFVSRRDTNHLFRVCPKHPDTMRGVGQDSQSVPWGERRIVFDPSVLVDHPDGCTGDQPTCSRPWGPADKFESGWMDDINRAAERAEQAGRHWDAIPSADLIVLMGQR